jgi:Ni/Co efflux regulator RcnB
MLRTMAIVAILALAGPMLAEAQEIIPPHHRPGERPHGPPHPRYEPRTQFIYRGRVINRIRVVPFVYPRGWAYRRWVIGAVLPPLFLVPAYFFADWATLGLEPPAPGLQWVRYGPDLLLVNVRTGQIVDVAYGVFY